MLWNTAGLLSRRNEIGGRKCLGTRRGHNVCSGKSVSSTSFSNPFALMELQVVLRRWAQATAITHIACSSPRPSSSAMSTRSIRATAESTCGTGIKQKVRAHVMDTKKPDYKSSRAETFGADNGASAYPLRGSTPASAACRRPRQLATNASRLLNARSLSGSSPCNGQKNPATVVVGLLRLERTTGLEPATPTLARLCSTN